MSIQDLLSEKHGLFCGIMNASLSHIEKPFVEQNKIALTSALHAMHRAS